MQSISEMKGYCKVEHRDHHNASFESGFTLIELLVVMIIIAILMAVAIPSFLGQKSKAVSTTAKRNLQSVVSQIESCSANFSNGGYREVVGASTTTCTDGASISASDSAVATNLQLAGQAMATSTTALAIADLTAATTATATSAFGAPSGKITAGAICGSASDCSGYWVAVPVKKGSDGVLFLMTKNPTSNATLKTCVEFNATTFVAPTTLSGYGFTAAAATNGLAKQICPNGTW